MYELTPREFANHAKGRAEIAKIEARNAWERTRFIAFAQVKAWGATKAESAEEWLPFDSPDEQEQQERIERAAKLFPKYI